MCTEMHLEDHMKVLSYEPFYAPLIPQLFLLFY